MPHRVGGLCSSWPRVSGGLASVLIALLLSIPAHGAEPLPTKTVLVLYAESQVLPGTAAVDDELKSQLRHSFGSIRFYTESLTPHGFPTHAIQTLRQFTWWQFLVICLPSAAIMAADTLGWRCAFARDRAPFWRLYPARVIGEALNMVIAVGSVGGDAAKDLRPTDPAIGAQPTLAGCLVVMTAAPQGARWYPGELSDRRAWEDVH